MHVRCKVTRAVVEHLNIIKRALGRVLQRAVKAAGSSFFIDLCGDLLFGLGVDEDDLVVAEANLDSVLLLLLRHDIAHFSDRVALADTKSDLDLAFTAVALLRAVVFLAALAH